MGKILAWRRHLHVVVMVVLEVTLLTMFALYVRFDEPTEQVILSSQSWHRFLKQHIISDFYGQVYQFHVYLECFNACLAQCVKIVN